MREPSDDLLEDEIELRLSDSETASISPSISTFSTSVMALGMEKEVKFKGSQQEGEAKARDYILASQEYYDLKEVMDNAEPGDERFPLWTEQLKNRRGFLKTCAIIPEVKEFIDLVTEKQILSEIEAMVDELVSSSPPPPPPPPRPPPLLGIRNPD